MTISILSAVQSVQLFLSENALSHSPHAEFVLDLREQTLQRLTDFSGTLRFYHD